MAAPWEKYAAPVDAGPADGPWAKYGAGSAAPAPNAAPENSGDAGYSPIGLTKNILRSVNQGLLFGFGDEANAAYRSAVYGEKYRDALADERKQLKEFQGNHPVTSTAMEIAGSLPTAFTGLGATVRGPLTLANVGKGALKVGGPMGAAYGVGNAEGDDPQTLATNALAGYGLGAAGYAAGAPIGAAIGKGAQIAGRFISDAWNPEQAAYRKLAERMTDANINPLDVRDVVTPASKIATTPAQVTEILKRSAEGQTQKQIAREMDLGPSVVADRIGQFNQSTQVPINMIDATKLVAREQGRQGAELPVSNLARDAASVGGEGPSIAAGRLVQRQVDQPGRIADHIENLTKGPSLDERLAGLTDTLENKSREAFGSAAKNQKPFDLEPVIKDFRGKEYNSAGEIKSSLGKAIDLFFKPGYEAAENNATRFTKFAGTIDDLERFQASRQALDQMVARSMQDGRPTPLTRQLTQFRQAVTKAAEDANPEFKAANAQFADAKSSGRIIDLAQKASTKAGEQRSTLSAFETMTPEQQDLFRTAFKQRMLDSVTDLREGRSTVTPFTSTSFKNFVGKVFEKKEAENLLSNFEKEGVTTQTLRDVFSGSRTAPLLHGMEEMKNGAAFVGDLLTANLPGMARRVGNRIATGLSQEQGKHILNIGTNTDRNFLYNALNRTAGEYTKNVLAAPGRAKLVNNLAKTSGIVADNALANRKY